MLRANLSNLRTEAGEHYADVLLRLYQRQLKELHAEQKVDQAEAEAIKEAAAAADSDQQADQAETLEVSTANEPDRPVGQVSGGPVQRESPQPANGAARSNGQHQPTEVGPIDKSALPIGAPRRIRDKEHLRFVASQPCLVCGRSPGHAHHVRFAQPRAMGRKVSDEWTIPLCATHHRSLHTVGNEEKWWKASGIDPITHAERLWQLCRGDGAQAVSRARELISPTPS